MVTPLQHIIDTLSAMRGRGQSLFVQVRLERVWGILRVPVTAKLDWVIRYTGPEGSDLFEPALQAWEQAAAAVLERERY